MKILLLAVCTLFISTLSFAQCDAPVVTDWTFVDSVTVEISLEMLGESSDFEMEFVSIYSDAFNGPPLGEALIFSNSFDQVNQTFLFSLSGLASQTETSIPEVNYYYEVQLRSICGSDSSSVYRFYVSPHSLLSDPAFEESPLQFNVISFLPDGLGESYVTNVQVPPSYSNQLIDSVFVLLDIGHTYNGDLDITLTSPSGIEVALLSFPNSLGGASGLSVLFKDGAAPQSDSPSNSLRGVYAPAGDLSDLVGEHGDLIYRL